MAPLLLANYISFNKWPLNAAFILFTRSLVFFFAAITCDGSLSSPDAARLRDTNRPSCTVITRSPHATDAPAIIDLTIPALASIPRSASSSLICCSLTDSPASSSRSRSGGRVFRLARTSSLNRCASSRFSCRERASKFTVSPTS